MNPAAPVPYVQALIAERIDEAERDRLRSAATAARRADPPRSSPRARLFGALIQQRPPDPCVQALIAVQGR